MGQESNSPCRRPNGSQVNTDNLSGFQLSLKLIGRGQTLAPGLFNASIHEYGIAPIRVLCFMKLIASLPFKVYEGNII